MKTLLILLLSALSLRGATFTLLWDANPASDFVTGYNVYEKLVSGTMNRMATVATNTAVFTNVTAGAHTWSVTAVNVNGESPFSSMVTFTNVVGLPSPPTNVTIKVSALLKYSPVITGPFLAHGTVDFPAEDYAPGFYQVETLIARSVTTSTRQPGNQFVVPPPPPLPK